MPHRTPWLILLILSCLLLPARAAHTLTVDAGAIDRRDTPVSFLMPKDARAGSWQLRGEDGAALPLEVSPDGQGHFILPHLPAKQSRTFQLDPAAAAAPGVEVAADGKTLKVTSAGHEMIRYQGEMSDLPPGFAPQFQRGGYISEVFTPAGKLVSDDYPPNHRHHHGIWSPWTKTQFEGRHPDFWNMGEKTGRVEFVDHGQPWSGAVCGGFTAHHRFVDLTPGPEPKVALNETWDVVIYHPTGGDKPYYTFDLAITQTCATADPLILPKYHYGGLGFRGNRAWDGKDNCAFLTSEGKDRATGNETRARWCHISGKVDGGADGAVAGIAILDHPANFRSPQPMRLHPTEPFFCYAPSQLGDWQIEPGKPYVARYRFIVADGPPDAEQINRMWNDYANPPSVISRQ